MPETLGLFADAWKLLIVRFPAARIKDADGVVSCFGNVPQVFFNASIISRPAATHHELRRFLETAAERAADCQHPHGVVVREDWLPSGWEALIQDAGFVPLVPMTGMETTRLVSPRRPAAKLEIRRLTNDATARDLALLNAQAYGMAADAFECISNMHLWHADSLGYVGYLDDEPVSCAAAFPVAGTVYVALVATLPEAQGRGFAETVVRHTVAEGQRAMATQRTALHASDMGLPVYRAMGYTPGPRLIFLGPA